ncbi:S8 family serine peptidase [bacterium]|nr:S8 family serine peptidase [bacterium]
MNQFFKNRNMGYCALMILSLGICIGLLSFPAQEALALDKSLNAVGIDRVKAVGLSGDDVNVGQLEGNHPDKNHPMLKDGWIIQRPDGTGNHAHNTHVAGILMGQSYTTGGKTYEGVAPGAHLQTTGVWSGNLDGFRDDVDWLTYSPQADIVNMSAGCWDDGHDKIADWAAAEKDMLFVVSAGNEGWSGGNPDDDTMRNPAEGYNVLAVGATGGTVNQDIDTEDYGQLAAYSSQGLDADTQINPDIVAPGSLIMSAEMGGTVIEKSGTSMAAPHVAGTAALLHEYSIKQEQQGKQGWNADSRDHKVMKAVLMNSADKSVKDKAGKNWLQSEAQTNELQALDDQLGTGGLDALQAYKQYEAGQHGPEGAEESAEVPLVGWDFFDNLPDEESRFYEFNQEITAGNWITATLVWDQHVERPGGGSTFTYKGLDDLDLWLWWGSEKGERDELLDNLSSYGFNNTTEHLHSLLPKTGWYTLEVDWLTNSSGLGNDDYGLAWHTTPEPSTYLLLVTGLGFLVFMQRRRKKRMNLSD